MGEVPVVAAGQSLPERVQVLRVWLSVRGRWPSEVAGDDDEKRLGRWVQDQRYRYRQGVMSAERQAALQAVPGWSWGSADPVRNRERGDARLEQLDAWMRGHGRPPRQTPQDPEQALLARWAASQRRKYEDGRLSPARVEALGDS